MNDHFTIIGLTISLGLSMFMLFTRMKKWLNLSVKITLSTIIAIIGFIGFPLSNDNEFRFLFYSMIVPIIYLLSDIYFKKLSCKYQGRDYYLYLRFSDDVDTRNKKFSTLDIVFSITSLIVIISMISFGVTLFGHENLYNKWF